MRPTQAPLPRGEPVQPLDTRGEIKTLFSPAEGKRYFDDQKTSGFRVLH
jgi:hypothetical protein